MPKALRRYFSIIILVGLPIMIYMLFVEKYRFEWRELLFITVMVLGQLYEHHNGNKFSFTLNAANTVFLIIFFGAPIAMIGLIISIFVSSVDRYKRNNRAIFISKTLFNLSQVALCVYLTGSFVKYFNIDPYGMKDIYLIVITIILYNLLNIFFVTLALSFSSGKLYIQKFSQKSFLFVFYLFLSSICLIFEYADRGILGALLVYLMFLPIQRISQLYTQIKDQKQELITDTLTKTYNYKYLEQMLHSKVKAKELFSLIFIDLDEFKKINDTYGHTAGNYLLQKFVEMIKPRMNRDSILCRYGGDEFCIIIRDRHNAETIALDILEHSNEYYIEYFDEKIKIPLSIGIYNHRVHGKSALDIIEEADLAMYKAKKMGGNRIVRCN